MKKLIPLLVLAERQDRPLPVGDRPVRHDPALALVVAHRPDLRGHVVGVQVHPLQLRQPLAQALRQLRPRLLDALERLGHDLLVGAAEELAAAAPDGDGGVDVGPVAMGRPRLRVDRRLVANPADPAARVEAGGLVGRRPR